MASPRTKLEKQVYDLSYKLPALTKEHEAYGNDKAFWKYFTVSRNRIHCLECGHKWKGNVDLKRHTCPECNTYLRDFSNDTWMTTFGWLMVMDKYEGFQVLRFMYIEKIMRKGQAPFYRNLESSQCWIHKTGKVTIMGCKRNGMSGGYHKPQYCFGSKLSIKKPQRYYAYASNVYAPYHTALYPKKKRIKELIRTGWTGVFMNLNPTELISSLLSLPALETLYKMGRMDMFRKGVSYPDKIMNYWDELKITFRRKYHIEDYGIWTDYIDMLRHYEKDTRNHVFVCPEDLGAAHTKYMRKMQREAERAERQRREEQIIEARKKVQDWREKYPKMRQAFLDFCIKHDHITIEVIKSVDQLEEEATLLDHCAFVNGYYSEENSLLLSARVDGVVVETIEINLQRMEIVQARGFNNKATAYNKKIVKLVSKHLPQIHELHKKQLKLSA